MFKLLAKALGEKSSVNNKEADKIAWIRIVILLQAIITNIVICAGVIHHW